MLNNFSRRWCDGSYTVDVAKLKTDGRDCPALKTIILLDHLRLL